MITRRALPPLEKPVVRLPRHPSNPHVHPAIHSRCPDGNRPPGEAGLARRAAASLARPPIGRQRATQFARAGNACRHPRDVLSPWVSCPQPSARSGGSCWARRRNETEQSRHDVLLPAIERPQASLAHQRSGALAGDAIPVLRSSAAQCVPSTPCRIEQSDEGKGHGRDNGSPTDMCDDRTATTSSSSVVVVPAHVYPASAEKQQSLTNPDDAAHAELKAASADALLAGATPICQASDTRHRCWINSSSAAAFPTSQCELVTEGAIQTAPGPIAREPKRCIPRKPFNQTTMPE